MSILSPTIPSNIETQDEKLSPWTYDILGNFSYK